VDQTKFESHKRSDVETIGRCARSLEDGKGAMKYVNLAAFAREHSITIETSFGRIDLHNDADLQQMTFAGNILRFEFSQAPYPRRFALEFSVPRIVAMQADGDSTLEDLRLLVNIWVKDLSAEVSPVEIDFGFLTIWFDCSQLEFISLET